MAPQSHSRRRPPDLGKVETIHFGHLAALFLTFAVLCWITGLLISTTEDGATYAVEPGQPIGPIVSEKANATYEITIRIEAMPNQAWTFVEGQLLDADREYLMSFGDELSQYSGYEGGEHWVERRTNYAAKLTIPAAGTYFLDFVTESSWRAPPAFRVTVSRLKGSSLAHLVAGLAAFLIAVVLNEMRNRTLSKLIARIVALQDDD